MKLKTYVRIAATLTTTGIVLVAFLVLLGEVPKTASADVADLFVAPDGHGACVQGDPCDLQTALGLAGSGDTVYVAGGSYTGTGVAVVTITESISLLGGWSGAPVGEPMRDPVAYPSTLDGERERRVIQIIGDITPTVEGLIITRGDATLAPADPGRGGGIYVADASPTIANNDINNNAGRPGSGTGYGGGIYLKRSSASTLITGNTFFSNTATILNQGYGGAVALNSASATISSNSLEANVAATGLGFGGGLYMIRSTATIVDNVFHGNDAGSTGYGGAFYGQISEATFSRNVVLSSTAQYGALFPEGISPFTVTNNIIAQNEGGIFVRGNPTFGVDAIVVNNTFAYNDDYGVYVGVRSGSDSAIVMTNNIIVSHSVGIHVEDEPTNGVTATHTLFYGNGLDTDGANIASTNEITGSDPLFTEGAGTIYVLQPGSPAIDAGTLVPWLTTDIDGAPRPIGDAYDIGAYETEGVVIRRIYMPSVLGSHQP